MFVAFAAGLLRLFFVFGSFQVVSLGEFGNVLLDLPSDEDPTGELERLSKEVAWKVSPIGWCCLVFGYFFALPLCMSCLTHDFGVFQGQKMICLVNDLGWRSLRQLLDDDELSE